MVAFKASQLIGFLKSPDPRFCAALLYGPDAGQVGDHATVLAKRVALASEPAGEIIRIDDRDLAEDPGRLETEAQTVSMFSARKVIRVTAGQRFPVDGLEALLAAPLEAWIIVEAGNLRPAAKLRKIFEASDYGVALPCYELSARDMAGFIDAELTAQGSSIGTEARQHLVDLFGGDQARARTEIVKLALFAGKGSRVELADIDAVIGDVAQAAFDTLSAAAGSGNRREALRQLDRLVAGGQGAQSAIAALGRHFAKLHKVCAAVEHGGQARAALASFRPPLHFRQRDTLEGQSRLWSRSKAEKAIDLVARAALAARRHPELEQLLAERLVLALGR